MDTEDRLKWLETRIASSLRPRADELRSLFTRDESRAPLIEFLSNDEAHRLFAFLVTEERGGGVKVSLSAPKRETEKCICFVKTGSASQLHAGNFDDAVTCLDWSEALPHADTFIRDVFLPLLCTDTELMTNVEGLVISQDKLMDILHRLLGNLEVSMGVSDDQVTLPLPCIDVLAEAAAFQPRQPAVVHVLESAVVGWIRQIRNLLRHDSLAATKLVSTEQNEPMRPHHEVIMWEKYIEHTTSLLEQLKAPIATDILLNLNHANSAYAQSFGEVQAEIEHTLEEAKSRLRCFATVLPWIQDMYRTSSVDKMLKVFPPLLQTVLLIWKHSDYYHDPKPFAQLLKMLSNEVVARARSLVGDNPFEDTQHSYTALKDALRLCAAFRGTYLDFKETANAYNSEKVESTIITMARLRPKDKNVLYRARMYGPTGYQQWLSRPEREDGDDEGEQWIASAWPPRNNKCFAGLSRFVERCNDLLDLVETTRHFFTLEEAARVGGAGSHALDALISDIHQVFMRTIRDFTNHNRDVLTIDEKQHFEKAFFHYRSVIKTLEHRLAGVLRTALRLCPNVMSHLRVLEVFEGISARELLQRELLAENHTLINSLTQEFRSVKIMFETSVHDVPNHLNMPPTVCKLVWVRALKERVGTPMAKVRDICPHALESDVGWQLRDAYTDVMNDLEKYETKLLTTWSRHVDADLRDRLKQPVLATEDLESTREISDSRLWRNSSRTSQSVDESEERGQIVSGLKVNLDVQLLEMLRDVHYLQQQPHNVPVPPAVRALLRSTDSSVLQSQSTRMRTIVSKHNHIVQRMQDYEQLLFENKMRKIDELISEGTEVITWGSADLEDFLEKTSSVICDDMYTILTRIHNNWDRVKDLSKAWSEGALDIFTSHVQEKQTKSLKDLLKDQIEKDDQYTRKLVPAGFEIHNLLQDSFEALQMSAASPAWQLYTAQMDAMVLMSLKSSILTSLDAMYTTIANLDESTDKQILEIRLELVEQTVSFSPPLDRSSAVDNVEDAISSWLSSFLKRSTLINRLTDPTSTYSDFLSNDTDVWEVVDEIRHVIQENDIQCKKHLSLFDNYKFLWVQDVQQSFTDFLNGRPSPNPLRVSKQSHKRFGTLSRSTTGQRSRFSPDAINEAERAFLTSHSDRRTGTRDNMRSAEGTMVVPGLADFDEEIGIYRSARDHISALPDHEPVGWIMFNFQPIKQVLTTYASKWMWTFIKYLSGQVTNSLDTLADFLARTEPEIESITGEERDTASFMKMMRLFNEVSAQQQDMDSRFSVMQKTVDLLEKYDMRLPNETQEMFKSAPDRWNHLKTKVSLAKQRLGPRIQEESDRITRDLLRFSERVESLASELRTSEVFSRECPIYNANDAIDGFVRRLRLLQTEAQDLIELQELLETAVVNFSVLPQYQRDLRNLKLVWQHVKMVQDEQRDWKLKHWQRIDTKHLHQAIEKQKDMIQSLPPEVTDWDVYMGMIVSVNVIEQCLPLVEDLNHPAMRTRHWKQLVRITGGLLQTDTDSLKKMVLGDLLELGLQKHADEVKAIVQRAVKDLTIESSLKTCEEVWLSKIFELRSHTRGQSKAVGLDLEAGSEMTGSEMMPHALLQTYEGSRTGTKTKSMKSGIHSRSSDKTGGGSVSRGRAGGRASVLSLPVSLLNLVDDPSPICLLKNVEKILSDLEHHQVELNRMQSNSAIGSFLDEVTKWQKRLHLIEAVLDAWVNVQTKWVQLDEVYSGADVRTALAHEANMFAVMSKDFRLLMRATEKNTNVLQSCSRKGLLPMLEKMDAKMEQCRHALLGNLERRRQRFPRFYFLSPEDVMNIVCYGYDLNAVNKYLCKILPHLGRLIFDEEPPQNSNLAPSRQPSAGIKKKYSVRGVESTSGEVTTLHKPLIYEGPMSLWLPQLLATIQTTLQEQLHVALGNEQRPAQIEQTLRSAGASKIRISRPSSAISQRSGGSHDNPPVIVSPPQTDTESVRGALSIVREKPSEMADLLGTTLNASVPKQQVSWTLDNSTQVVILATMVQMNERLHEAMAATSSGDQSALNKVADAISDGLHAAVIMLKGIEDEKAVRLSSARRRISRRDKQEANDDVSNASESLGAPSTRSSLEADLYVDENFNDDGIGQGDSGQAPIETMQSLLFTDQLRSGSRGTQKELEQLEQKQEDTVDATSVSDGKLLLFPSQIRKISGLIGVLTQQRDICRSLRDVIIKDGIKSKPDDAFEWQGRLKHVYNKDDMLVNVHCMDWKFEYGYEYQGSCARYVVSPSCDRVILSMCQALKSNIGVALTSNNSNILSELSYQLGRALYSVLCTQSIDHYMLGDLFKGIAETGCWVCLQNIDNLEPSVLSVAGQLSAEVHRALMAGKPSITLMSEEVTLSPHAACFVTMNGESRGPNGPNPLNRAVPTTGITLPEECMSNFRVINAITPDRRAVLEIQLLAQGFTQAEELSKKLCIFLDLCGSLLSTLPTSGLRRMTSATTKGIAPNIAYHENLSTSLLLIDHVIAGAGVVLDSLMREQLELKQEYRDTILAKTKKFANIWRHRSSLMSSSGGLASSFNDDSGNELPPGGVLSSSSIAPSVDPTTQEAIQVNKDREVIESDAESMRKMEEVAIATSLRNILSPRLPVLEDRSLISTFVVDLWPDADVDFGLDDADEMNTQVTIPNRPIDSDSTPFQPNKPPDPDPVNDVEAAVAIATSECHLSPAVGFQSRVAQLTELMESMRSVIVHGSAGCGKSRCVDVYTQTQKQLGYNVACKKVYVNAIDSRRKLFGYFESDSREWRDGLMQGLLRPHCLGQDAPTSTHHSSRASIFLLHVDGSMKEEDSDIFIQLLKTDSNGPTWLSLSNNERLCIPLDLRVVWEMEDLSSLTPSVISQLALLGFNGTEVTWKLHLTHWIENLPNIARSVTRDLTLKYFTPLLNYFTKTTTPEHLVTDNDVTTRLRQTMRVSAATMTCTFCKLMDCLLPQQNDASPAERERYIGYSAFWAFGGTLDADSRQAFVTWWCEYWPNFFPQGAGDPWRQFVDAESRNFARWDDHLPQFSGLSGTTSAFVHTPDVCQLTHLVGVLMDAGFPSMMVGPLGCGKSAVLRERVNNVSSGEVAEVLSLFVHCNILTEAGTLWARVSEHLEWKHGLTHTPRGNKKLLCMVDDMNLARPLGTEDEETGLQSACELIRQHLDAGGVRNPLTYKWQQVSNTTYVTTVNPHPTGTSCKMTQRMTRHFSVFSCPYPLVATQHTIFSVLLQSHFLPNLGSSSTSGNDVNFEYEKHMENLLSDVAMVTVELQERLRHMYLSTPERAHYNFALGDLERIFRNLMLSLAPGCHQRDLLLLWRHECDWAYGRRMVSDVDRERYKQSLETAVRKYLTDNKYLPIILASKQPLFSSVRELDSGIVTAGRHVGRNTATSSGSESGAAHVTDYYKPVTNHSAVHDLLMEALKEYNKVNVQMRLSLYEDTITLVCRLARIIQSPHQTSHTLLFGEGCPVLGSLMVNLAGHLGGFRVVTLPPIVTPLSSESHGSYSSGPSSLPETERIKLSHFKRHIVQLYNQAGVKGEKIIFLLYDDKALTNECLTIVEELVRHGTISHLFTLDEQTTIANSVRSDVTAAGFTYSRDVAWNFFLNTVTKNLRVVLVCSQTGQQFMSKSLEFPSLFNRFNAIVLHHWSHEQLASNALYKFSKHDAIDDDVDAVNQKSGRSRWVMDRRRQENVAHLLANIHTAVKVKDGDKFYRIPGHVSNYAYEKLVERFLHLYHERRKAVKTSQVSTGSALENIDRENAIAEALQNDLDREKQVLAEHKAGTLQLLAQIGQDMVITEQQVSAVRRQVKKIRHLKKTLPEYQLAHEKAVFKAAAIVADTKKVVKEIDVQELSELRSLQKPDTDVEDLMAAIIMILKSPNSDVTWSKGAKRQMANLDRFLDELASFDEMAMPLSTLDTLESFWEKETFTPENLTVKAGGNTAAGSLLRWVQGVLRYHTTMINKVKPLHAKVQETSSSIGDAQHKLRQLESKKEALEARLRDLADGFEQATADKNCQGEKRKEMEEHLRVAAKFRQVLAGEHRRCLAVLDSYEDRLEWVVGAAIIAAGFATYLAPYPFMFRRMMLTVDWAQCLVEKRIPLVFDSTDPVKGHVIEFMLDINENMRETSPHKVEEGDAMLDAVMKAGKLGGGEEEGESLVQPSLDQSTDNVDEEPSKGAGIGLPPVLEATDADDEGEQGEDEEDPIQPEVETTVSQSVGFHPYTSSTFPYISNDEYLHFVNSLIKILTGDDVLQEWITKDFAHHQLQNAAVMLSSWQRPPLLLDPYLAGADWCAVHLRNNRNIIPVNLASKIETTHVNTIEKAVLGGHTLMLMDCEHQAGSLVRPLIHHSNTAGWRTDRAMDENQTVRFLGRRLLCPDSFTLYLTTTQTTASKLHPDIVAATQLISYVPSVETLQEDLLLRALSRVRPDIYRERRRVAHSVRQHRHTLAQLDAILCERLVTGNDPKAIENSTKFLSSVVELKASISTKLHDSEDLLASLTNLTEELFPIAQRGALLYSICRAIPVLNMHYQIPLPFFTHLFDSSVGSEFEEGEEDSKRLQDVEVIHPADVEEQQKRSLERRKASLRLGSAKKTIRGMVENMPTTTEEEGEEKEEVKDIIPPPADAEPETDDDAASEIGSHVMVPDSEEFPMQEYENFSSDKVMEIVNDLTKRVFASMYSSVYPEHRLHVISLALLTIQSEGAEVPFSEEELALLVHGNPGFGRQLSISLADFECASPVPDWLPADRWEDLLAFSILPGSLEGVCVRVAEASDQWRAWYEKKEPENDDFPAPQDEQRLDLSDFQRLLLLRTLRPDRYEPALKMYMERNIKDTPIAEVINKPSPIDAETLFKDVSNTLGILILLPESIPETLSRVAMQPTDVIKRLADKYKVTVESVTLGKGYQQEATRCIDAAVGQDSWALILGLHLAPDKFFDDLQIQLARVGNISRHDDGNNGSNMTSQGGHFQVWLTSQSHDSLPSLLTQYLYKISWDSLLRLVAEDSSSLILPPSNCSVLKSCLISSISKIPSDLMTQWKSCDDRSILYVICLMHSVMLSRHCFGWHGNNRIYSILDSTLYNALQYAMTGEKNLAVLKNIYDDVIETETDQIYFHDLFDDVMRQTRSKEGQKLIVLNGVKMPVPPQDVAPADYPSWLCGNIPDDFDSSSALAIPSSATTWQTTQRGSETLAQMQDLFNAVQQPGYESKLLSPGSKADAMKYNLTLTGLQGVLDMCLEKLPSLLELGENHTTRLTQFDFPYHRPSVLSSGNPEVLHMPETIGFVLLQECIWFNQCLCNVSQQLHCLRSQLFVTSDYRLSEQLRSTATSLASEEVPYSWQHLHEFPNTHVLLTWLNDVIKRYIQMRSWVKSGMVPLEGRTPVGNLSYAWLGGMVNPGSLLAALCQEKAVLHDVTMDQIRICCVIPPEDHDVAEQEAGIYLEDVHVINAKLDKEKGCITIDDGDVTIPHVYFYPNLISEEKSRDAVEYPVYINVSRQHLVCYLSLPSCDVTRYSKRDDGPPRSTDSYVILQAGPDVSNRDVYKSRAYLAQKRREDWARVSPAVSEMMSRSGTRLSSRMSGPRISITSIPASTVQKAGSLVKSQSTGPGFGSQQQLSVTSQKSLSDKSLSSHATSPPPPDPEPLQNSSSLRVPNGDVIHLKTKVPSESSNEGGAKAGSDVAPPPGDVEQRGHESDTSSSSSSSDSAAEQEPSNVGQEGGLLQTILGEESEEDEARSQASSHETAE